MITLEEISKQYGETNALQNISITFPAGKTTVLIGPSGCGKSTILRLINGLIAPSHGTISIDGKIVEPQTVIHIRRRIGYVIQEGGLFPHLTACENITLLSDHLKKSQELIVGRVRKLCALTHFDEALLGRYPLEISGGQRQRVSLMRALMLDPEVLLLDEPLGALDPMVRAALQQELKQIFTELKKTVVLVTHDLPEAAYFADTIILMDNGAVEQIGSLEDLQTRPQSPFVSQFITAQRSLTTL